MPVSSYTPGPDGGRPQPPLWGTPRRMFALVVVLLFLVLGGRACAMDALQQTAAAPTSTLAAGEPTLAPLSLPTFTPAAAATTVAGPAPTSGPTASVCPPAAPPPVGSSPGWLGRAAGCPDLLFALVDGEQRWVLRPSGFPEDLYRQLPELQP